jgi:hypothetical protein
MVKVDDDQKNRNLGKDGFEVEHIETSSETYFSSTKTQYSGRCHNLYGRADGGGVGERPKRKGRGKDVLRSSR